MVIKVLGSGCSKCKKLEENVRKAVAELGWKVEQHSDVAKNETYVTVEKITDLKEIMSYGIMSTPALVIDEKVVSSGRLLSVSDVIKLLG
jgi:small redox-active disulfide protein 2